jgi:hypothetical protein
MSNQRQLEDIAIWDWQWASTAFQMLTDRKKGFELAADFAHQRAKAVVLDRGFSVDDLREEARQASVLDTEAVEKLKAGSPFTKADHLEALARRVAHTSLEAALDLVKSDNRRRAYLAALLADNSAPGVGLGYGLAHTEINDLGFAGFATEP